MQKNITAQQVVDRIKSRLGSTWKDSPADVFHAGNPDTVVTGIATSFTPSIEVLKRAAAAAKNLVITQQPAYYSETQEYLKNDPAFLYKKDLIGKNGLVLWRFYDNWNLREADGQLRGLAKALGWDKFHLHNHGAADQAYAGNKAYFELPAGSLREKIKEIRSRLKIQGLRVIGDPAARIRRAVVSQGMFKLSELQDILKGPEVDLVIIAEAIEWESCEYFRDILTWKGKTKP